MEEETVTEQEFEQKLNSSATCYGLLTIQIKMDGSVRIRRMIDQEFQDGRFNTSAVKF